VCLNFMSFDLLKYNPVFRRQILSLLKKLHDAGFVQKDLRSSNILKAEDGSIRLIDLELVTPHKCSRSKKRGSLLKSAVGRPCRELVKVSSYLQLC
jgi:serine/threonine protein kinase